MVATVGIAAPPIEEPTLVGIVEDVQNAQIIPIAKMGTSGRPQSLQIPKKIPQGKNKKHDQTHQLRDEQLGT